MIPKSVAAHYKNAPSPHKETMLEMRNRILTIIPNAEEVTSYGMPAFKVNGNIVAGLLANKKHVGYYPFSGSVLQLFKKELSKYSHTKSAIHVPIDKPLSKSFLSKLIKVRISQCPVKQGKVDLSKYEKLDKVWKDLGLAAPARRALVDNGLLKFGDFKRFTAEEVSNFHGIGNNALVILKRAKVPFKK